MCVADRIIVTRDSSLTMIGLYGLVDNATDSLVWNRPILRRKKEGGDTWKLLVSDPNLLDETSHPHVPMYILSYK